MGSGKMLELATLTREEIRAVAPDSLAVLPVGAIEQHGPHLPVNTDTEIVKRVCFEAAERAFPDIRVLVAPTVAYGVSHHHKPHPGVLTLSGHTMIAVLMELSESLIDSGFHRIAIINGHGGNSNYVSIVAREINNHNDVTITGADCWSIVKTPLSVPLGHAGEFETSIMQHLTPDLVTDGIPAPSPTRESKVIVDGTRVYLAARRSGLGLGYTDNPQLGTAAKGALLFDALADGLTDFFKKVHAIHPVLPATEQSMVAAK
ncbi:creatininase family protein [Pelagibius litoralis]|uniref:Creatininase family protein n=1 Tax=Pelagibius litoralis TaxID=374515 RepID=A0A967KBA3_9PROT|nr:creatininase family protein [Pelagibius litoralis]NIA70962.1 creatininase family protein [Pelagibius litoralis]